jgi:hypothetical protein
MVTFDPIGAVTWYWATNGLFDEDRVPGGEFFCEKNEICAGTDVAFDKVFVAVITTGVEPIDVGAV